MTYVAHKVAILHVAICMVQGTIGFARTAQLLSTDVSSIVKIVSFITCAGLCIGEMSSHFILYYRRNSFLTVSL